MGLFSSSSKTYVSSTTYPLGAEALEDRVDFAQYLVLNSLLQGTDVSRTLTQGYLTGGGMKFKAAYRYARDKYTHGLPVSGMLYSASPDREVIAAILNEKHAPSEVYLTTAVITVAEFVFWAEAYLAEEYGYDRLGGVFTRPPDGVDVDAAVSFDVERNGIIRILLMNADESVVEISYRPKDLNSGSLYLHTVYQLVQGMPTEITPVERPFELGDVTGVTAATVTVQRENEIQETLTKITTTTDGTTTTVVTEVTVRVMSRPKYFMYRLGAGTYPTLDALRSAPTVVSPFYPSVPLRVDNVDFTSAAKEETPLYKTSSKLMKQSGVDFEAIADQLRENAQIKEIDFAFIQYGVALNTEMPEGKKYIYRFFEMIQNASAVSKADYTNWENEQVGVVEAEMDDLGGDPFESGTKVPPSGFVTSGYSSPPTNRLDIRDADAGQTASALNITLEWQWADVTQHSGAIFPGAKPGDCVVGTSGSNVSINLFSDIQVDNSVTYASRQIDADTYEKIVVSGLVYTNRVYQDKTVIVTAYEAMTVADEEGFILPLNFEIFREMGMKDSTQLSYECMHMVLNSYQIVKKKWYQQGWFKVLIIIVAIVLIVISMGTATAPIGAAGAAAAGTAIALGVSFLVASYLVATVAVLGMMVIMKLLTPVFVDLFGEKWGRVILAITSILVMNYANTGSLLGSMSNAPLNATTIIRGSSSILDVYGAYNQGAMAELDIPGQTEKLKTEYEERMKDIEKMTRELLGRTDLIDITGFIEATAAKMEAPQDFLNRTLITGSEVAAITIGQIENFADVGLQLPNTG